MYVTTLPDFLKQVYVLMLMDLPPSGRDLGSHSRVPNNMMMMVLNKLMLKLILDRIKPD